MDRSESDPIVETGNRLDSWKEIASYLGRGVRTVQRWEQQEGLPVRRHVHDKRGTVFALRTEIDEWRREREAGGVGDEPEAAAEWTIRPVTADRGHEHDVSFSPDGSRIVYAWHDAEADRPQLYVQALDGGPRRRLTNLDQAEFAPAWSPDGRWIAAGVVTAERERRVALIAPETGVQRVLFEPTAVLGGRTLTWTPDSQWLVASLSLDDGRPGILAYRLEDGFVQTLVDPADQFVPWTPAVSSDGRRLAFASWTSDSVSEIFVQNLDERMRPEGKPRQVTKLGSTAAYPAFILGGRELLFRSGWWASRGVWRVPAEGGKPRRTSPAAEGVEEFAYHPRTGRLLFSRLSAATDIWRQPICDCRDRREAVVESTLNDLNMKISPDGRRLAFASNRSGRFQIWVADADGSNPRRLTDLADTMTGTPRWSPDSRLLAFDSRIDGQAEIFVVDADGGEPQRITDHPAADVTPSWSADGRWIYFGSDRTGRFEVWKTPAGGGEAIPITSDGAFTAAESPDGETLYFARRRPYYVKHDAGPATADAESGEPKPEDLPGTSLWRMPAAGGSPSVVAATIDDWSKFAPVAGGAIYVACERDEHCGLYRYHADGNRSEQIGRLPRRLEIGFDVSPDEQAVFYSTVDAGEGDLMLVEGFR